jgi:cytidyltransferase-like protein
MSSQKITALYPGTFDALTHGHLDIINRAARTFDQVVVAVAFNREKTPMFTVNERVEAIQAEAGHLVNVKVDSFSMLTVEYAIKIGAKVIVRGSAGDVGFRIRAADGDDEPSDGIAGGNGVHGAVAPDVLRQFIPGEGNPACRAARSASSSRRRPSRCCAGSSATRFRKPA